MTTRTTPPNVLQAITIATTNIQHLPKDTSTRCVQTQTSTTITTSTMKPGYIPHTIHCGRCHFYKTDNRFKKNVKVGNKWRPRHVCPVTTCESVDICGYEAGHRQELKERRNAKRKDTNVLKEKESTRKRVAKAKAKLEREEMKKTTKQKKLEKKRKHMFERTRKLSTYLKNIGVSET